MVIFLELYHIPGHYFHQMLYLGLDAGCVMLWSFPSDIWMYESALPARFCYRLFYIYIFTHNYMQRRTVYTLRNLENKHFAKGFVAVRYLVM